MSKALGALSEEDPTFRVHTDEETGQTIIAGHGRAPPRGDRRPHAAGVPCRRHGGQAAGGLPRDHHQDDPQGAVRHKKQTGGSGQFAEVVITIEPHRSRRRLRVRGRASRAGSSHASTSPPSTRASSSRMTAACSPATRWSTSRSTLFDGGFHDVDSLRDGVQDRRHRWCFKEAARPGRARPARADHAGRGRHPRGLHGRRHRRPQRPPGQGRQDGAARQQPGHLGAGAARRDVRLRHRPALAHPGPSHVHACSSRRTSRCRRASPTRSSAESVANDRPRPRTTSAPTSETGADQRWPRRSLSVRSRM